MDADRCRYRRSRGEWRRRNAWGVQISEEILDLVRCGTDEHLKITLKQMFLLAIFGCCLTMACILAFACIAASTLSHSFVLLHKSLNTGYVTAWVDPTTSLVVQVGKVFAPIDVPPKYVTHVYGRWPVPALSRTHLTALDPRTPSRIFFTNETWSVSLLLLAGAPSIVCGCFLISPSFRRMCMALVRLFRIRHSKRRRGFDPL